LARTPFLYSENVAAGRAELGQGGRPDSYTGEISTLTKAPFYAIMKIEAMANGHLEKTYQLRRCSSVTPPAGRFFLYLAP